MWRQCSPRIFASRISWRVPAGRPASEFSLAVSYRPTWMDFRTTHIDGTRRKRLTEDYYAVQGSVGADLNDALTLKLDGGAYDGFSTYRALWMDEYNRLKFRDRLGYRDADPWGCNVSPSLRLRHRPTPDSWMRASPISTTKFRRDIRDHRLSDCATTMRRSAPVCRLKRADAPSPHVAGRRG